MKPRLWITISLILWLSLLVAPRAAAQDAPAQEGRTLSVLGYGEATAPPDRVAVTMMIGGQSASIGPAGPEFSLVDAESVQILVDVLTDLGIEEESIETNLFGRSLAYGPTMLAGEVHFSYENPANLNEFLAEVLAGLREQRGPTVQNVDLHFYLDDCAALEEEAWVAALADARARAGRAAQAMDVTVGPIQSVAQQEVGNGRAGCIDVKVSSSPLEVLTRGVLGSANDTANNVTVSVLLDATFRFE